jgi:hypothetical protein
MAFDLLKRKQTPADWSRGGSEDVVLGAEDGVVKKHGKTLVVGALAGVVGVVGWLMWGGGKKRPTTARHNQTFIMTKTPSGRVYAGPIADYYRKA